MMSNESIYDVVDDDDDNDDDNQGPKKLFKILRIQI